MTLAPEPDFRVSPASPAQATVAYLNGLVADLQRENQRLQRLVSELLLKNQHLREGQDGQ